MQLITVYVIAVSICHVFMWLSSPKTQSEHIHRISTSHAHWVPCRRDYELSKPLICRRENTSFSLPEIQARFQNKTRLFSCQNRVEALARENMFALQPICVWSQECEEGRDGNMTTLVNGLKYKHETRRGEVNALNTIEIWQLCGKVNNALS